tara:strand:- start:4805 stop:5659 length:855 start_codon:yes stop_codon:yes gene_type:complete
MKKYNANGWIPDKPDIRDRHLSLLYGMHTNGTMQAGADFSVTAALPTSVDLRGGFSPIEDQGHIGSCVANACVGILEYMELKAFNKYLDGSRLFVYKNARMLDNFNGDTGSNIRTAIKSLRLFGVAPEQYMPYDINKFDEVPSAYQYAMASNFKSLKYFRVDRHTWDSGRILLEIKKILSMKIPMVFGFTCYNSVFRVGADGNIPFPTNEPVVGGHAMVLCGYDDAHQNVGTSNKGAFLIRNSWGSSWGMGGYAWLPYDYLTNGLMEDIWAITKQDWVDTDVFN